MKVLIDNGHGIDTKGKHSPEKLFFEYEWNRDIAKRVYDGLQAANIDCELIVPEINDISLKERVQRVNDQCKKLGTKNIIFISVHGNAAGNATQWMKARGWCAFTSKGQTKSDALAECLYTYAKEEFTKEKGLNVRTDRSDGDSDWEENFYVLRNTLCPAVLTENFFYDNKDDLAYMTSEEGRQAIARVHVCGILQYLNNLK